MLSFSGTFSVSRSSASGSASPSRLRQISAVSSRSLRALDHGLEFRGGQAHVQFTVNGLEAVQKHLAVVDLLGVALGEFGQQVADLLLALFAGGDVG
jgi:F420-0:gamma-glutamyl ligase